MGKFQRYNDNDIVESERRYNDNDIVEKSWTREELSSKEEVLKDITEYRLNRIEEFLFGGNKFMSDCGVFVNPAIKQIDRFMYFWRNDLSEESRKKIIIYSMHGTGKRPYSNFTNSPLWKYESSVFKLMHNYTCKICKKKFTPTRLVVHHITYEHIGSELDYPDDIAVLCTNCHMAVHGIRGKENEK